MMLLRSAKNLAKAIGSPVIDRFGVYQRRIDRLTAAPGAWTIVMYHRVIADAAADPFRLGMCVRRDRFEQQIVYLRRHFNPIAVHEAVDRLKRGEALPARALSITFDDGYLDNLTHALPLLEAHGMPAALYVPTGGMDDGQMLWWDRVIAAVACTERSQLDLSAFGGDRPGPRVGLSPWQRPSGITSLLDWLWALPARQMQAAVQEIERQLQARVSPALSAQRLDAGQIREMHRRGMEIGAHSVQHPNLALAGDDEVRSELQQSRTRLQEIVQDDVPGMAYPGGRLRADTVRIAEELGFGYAMSSHIGANLPPLPMFELFRVGMPDSPMADFRRAFGRALVGRQRRLVPAF
jgi:peptidoglycan/xylan/chitin deacetylase (PgdA/CDA1 family)